jgi:hypothetical protein
MNRAPMFILSVPHVIPSEARDLAPREGYDRLPRET